MRRIIATTPGVFCCCCIFSLLNVLLLKWFFFSKLLRTWIICCILCRFYSVKMVFPWTFSFSVTLRNPNTCYKKKIKLQNILRCTDALWEEDGPRKTCLGKGAFWDKAELLKGSLFADHRSAVPLSRDTFGNLRRWGEAYIFLRCQSCAKSLTCFTLQINVLWSRDY